MADTRQVGYKTVHSPQTEESVSKSKQLDAVQTIDKQFRYSKDNLVKPEYDLSKLAKLYKSNYAHKFCVDTKATCISGIGYKIVSKLAEVHGINDQEMLAEINRLERQAKDAGKPPKEGEEPMEPLTPEEEETLAEYRSVYKKHSEDKKKVSNLFKSINPKESFTSINYKTDVDREAFGFSCWEVIRNGKGDIVELYHMPAVTVRMMANGLGVCQIKNPSPLGTSFGSGTNSPGVKKVFFPELGLPVVMESSTGRVCGKREFDKRGRTVSIEWYRDPTDRSKTLKIPESEWAHEVLIFRKYNPDNFWYGMPDIIAAMDACAGDRAAADYQEEFFENDAVPRMAVVVKGAGMSDDVKQGIENFFSQDIHGNPGCTLVLNLPGESKDELGEHIPAAEVKFEKLAFELTDASFRDYRKDNRDQVFIAHRVPGSLSPSPNNQANKDTALVDLENFKSQVAKPEQKERQFVCDRVLIEDNLGVHTWGLEFEEIDSIDAYRKMQIYNGYLTSNTMTINEVRNRLGLAPKKGGDVAFRITPLGLVKLEDIEKLSTGDLSAKPDAPLAGPDGGKSAGGRPKSKGKEAPDVKNIADVIAGLIANEIGEEG